jgi:hypothetical protein
VTGAGGQATLPYEINRVGRHIIKQAGASAAGLTAVGLPAPSTQGTAAAADDADGNWTSYTTGTALGDDAYIRNGDLTYTQFRRDWNPLLVFRVKSGSAVTTAQYWVGCTDGSVVQYNATDPANNGAAFRYSTDASDTNWMAWTNDGSGGGTLTDTGVAVSANTAYTLRIDLGASDVTFYVNGVVKATHTTNLPGSTTSLGFIWAVSALAGSAARAFRFGRLSMWWDG